jgi:hypothetical protein
MVLKQRAFRNQRKRTRNGEKRLRRCESPATCRGPHCSSVAGSSRRRLSRLAVQDCQADCQAGSELQGCWDCDAQAAGSGRTDMNRVAAARTTGCYRKSVPGTTKHTGCSRTHTHEHQGLWREIWVANWALCPGERPSRRVGTAAAAAQHEEGRAGLAARLRKRPKTQHTNPLHNTNAA